MFLATFGLSEEKAAQEFVDDGATIKTMPAEGTAIMTIIIIDDNVLTRNTPESDDNGNVLTRNSPESDDNDNDTLS